MKTKISAVLAALALGGVPAAAVAAAPSVTFLGISAHGDVDTVIAKVASASLLAALNAQFPLVPADKYLHTATALGAPSPSPEDVSKVSAALGLGYLVAGAVEDQPGGKHAIALTLRRGINGQVVNHYRFDLAGDDLDDDTALLMDGQIVGGIARDAFGPPYAAAGPVGAPLLPPPMVMAPPPGVFYPVAPPPPPFSPRPPMAGPPPAIGPQPVPAPMPVLPPVVASGPGPATSPASRPVASSPASMPAKTKLAEAAPEPPAAPLARPEDENPFSTAAAEREVTGHGSEWTESDDAGATPAGEAEAEAPAASTAGDRGRDRLVAEADAGLSLLARSFTFANPAAQRFYGPLASALRADAAIYPLAAWDALPHRRYLGGLGVGAAVDLGPGYSTPFNAGGASTNVSVSQELYELGIRYRLDVRAWDWPISLRASLGYSAHAFAIQPIAGLGIPSITFANVQSSLGVEAPVVSIVRAFATAGLLLPIGVEVDVAKFPGATAAVGWMATTGISVVPTPWLSVAAAFDAIAQDCSFARQGSAMERYLGGTLSVGIRY